MSRRPTGHLKVELLTDGTHAFRLRFLTPEGRKTRYLHERRECDCGCGGGWTERTARTELANVIARVSAGINVDYRAPTKRTRATPQAVPTFLEYASRWLQAKSTGDLGDRPLAPNTKASYLRQLRNHLLPRLARVRLDEIDEEMCLNIRSQLLAESRQLAKAVASGAKLKRKDGSALVPFGPPTVKLCMALLAAILEDAVEDGHIPHNPARSKRLRVKVDRPTRTFLEQDELAALLDAAATEELSHTLQAAQQDEGTRGAVARLAARRTRPAAIAAALGISKATVTYHLRRLQAPSGAYAGRRAIVATLGYAGPRVSELCDLRIRDVRLHDPQGTRFRITDAKTPTGVREVQVSPELAQELTRHIEALRGAGLPTDPDAYLFPNRHGGRSARQRIHKIVREAAAKATESAVERGAPPLPNTTPHTLRRTYISIALLASGYDLRWVMSQVGHADSSMTLDVYAQLLQRHERGHGEAFDRLVQEAREQLYGAERPAEAAKRTAIRTESEKNASRPTKRRRKA